MSERDVKYPSLPGSYRSPHLPQTLREEIPWEQCFPKHARYIRLLSKKDIIFHEAPTGGYGVFNVKGELLSCKGSFETVLEWIHLELEDDCMPVLMH